MRFSPLKINLAAAFSISFFVLLLIASTVFAQPTQPGQPVPEPGPLMNSQPTSASNMVAIALESVGYKAQEQVLNQLSRMLWTIGILIWIGCIMALLYSGVMEGKFERLLWVVIGPVLFAFAISSQTVGRAVDWRAYEKGTEILQPVVGTDPQANVSWLFHTFNRLISSFSAELVKFVTSDQSKNLSKKFMTRENLLARLLSKRVTDGGLITYSSEVLASCNKALDAARVLAVAKRDPTLAGSQEYKRAEINMSALYETEIKDVKLQVSQDYLETLLKRELTAPAGVEVYQKCKESSEDRISEVEEQLQKDATAAGSSVVVDRDFAIKRVSQKGGTCRMHWCWMGLGFQNEIKGTLSEFQKENRIDDAAFKEIQQDLIKKLTQVAPVADARDSTGRTVLLGANPVTPDESLIPVIIGGYLLRSALIGADIHSTAFTHFADRARVEMPNFDRDRKYKTSAEQQGYIKEDQQEQIGAYAQEEIIAFAAIIPYYQGIIIYALALLYPFFALLLIVPGKAGSFLMWFRLLIWVKSWDIGWGIVYLLEDFLWNLVPHTAIYDPLRDPLHGPVSVFAAAFAGDPGYGIGNYFTVVSTLVAGVPVLTAQMLLGANASIATSFLSGLRSFAQMMGTKAKKAVTVRQLMKLDALRENGATQYALDRMDITKEGNITNPYIKSFYDNKIMTLQKFSDELGERMKKGETNMKSAELLDRLFRGQGIDKQLTGLKNSLLTQEVAIGNAKNTLDKSIQGYMKALTVANTGYNYYDVYQKDPTYRNLSSIESGHNFRGESWRFGYVPREIIGNLENASLSVDAELARQIQRLNTAPNTSTTGG